MSLEELRRFSRGEPFVPFRLTLADGRTFDVPRPGLMIVSPSVVMIGLLDAYGQDAVGVEKTSLNDVVRVEPLG